jgi:hypothetical protein
MRQNLFHVYFFSRFSWNYRTTACRFSIGRHFSPNRLRACVVKGHIRSYE